MQGHANLRTTKGYLHIVRGAINDMRAKIDGIAKGPEEKKEKKTE
jgi:hypothetical protein